MRRSRKKKASANPEASPSSSIPSDWLNGVATRMLEPERFVHYRRRRRNKRLIDLVAKLFIGAGLALGAYVVYMII
jgi:hypothetical protein